MCWCIGKAASDIKEFYMLPVDKKLMQYDNLAVCSIVANREGEVSSCDIPFSDNLQQFNTDYLRLTKQGKHSDKCTFYSLRFGCSFAVANTIKPQVL